MVLAQSPTARDHLTDQQAGRGGVADRAGVRAVTDGEAATAQVRPARTAAPAVRGARAAAAILLVLALYACHHGFRDRYRGTG